MKKTKSIILCLFVGLFVCFILFIQMQEMADYKIIYVNELNDDTFNIYCLDSNNDVVMVECKDLDDEVISLIDYYTIYQNALPQDYKSPLGYYITGVNVSIENNCLFVTIQDTIEQTQDYDLDKFIKCIKLSYEEYNKQKGNKINCINLTIGYKDYIIKL